jgi:phenylacetate-CoA ligase
MLDRARHLARMLRNERRPEAQLVAEQEQHLREIVQHAARRVPVYRRLYAEHGVDPATVRGLQDLSRLPVVDKRVLSAAGAEAESLDVPEGCVTITTSGSTGRVFSFRVDPQFNAWRKAQYLRPYLTNGRRLTDKVLRLTAFPSDRAPWFAGLGLLREYQFGCSIDPADIVSHWRRLRPDVLQGYPSALRVLAQHCVQHGIELSPAPRRVFTDSELLAADTRTLLANAFGCPIVDVFGTYETDNIAYQCELGAGYHVAVDCVVAEVLRDGQPVRPGEAGELVVTVLHNRTTPLIRYNLHDIVAFATRPCACGRSLPLLRVIAGRADDQVVLPDGRERSPIALLGRLDGLCQLLHEFQVEQTAADRFLVRVVPVGALDSSARQRIEAAIRHEVPQAVVDVRVQEAIPRAASGKFKAFVSRLSAASVGVH